MHDWAGVHIALKDYAGAVEKLEKDTTTGTIFMSVYTYLALENLPLYDPLRQNPRFQKILADAKEIYEKRLRKYGDL